MNEEMSVILDSIAELIYEWDVARNGWDNVKNFAELVTPDKEEYREIAKTIADIVDNFLDNEFLEDDEFNDIIESWEF